jgi:hypothetical protein
MADKYDKVIDAFKRAFDLAEREGASNLVHFLQEAAPDKRFFVLYPEEISTLNVAEFRAGATASEIAFRSGGSIGDNVKIAKIGKRKHDVTDYGSW